MFEWSAGPGLATLFAAAFVSATVLPANSEIVLVAVVKAFPQHAFPAIVIATLGNTLGGLTTYGIGRLLPRGKAPSARAMGWVQRHGAAALLLSWVPVIGDALCAAAGWLRVSAWSATAAMAAGKLARYVVVAHAASLL